MLTWSLMLSQITECMRLSSTLATCWKSRWQKMPTCASLLQRSYCNYSMLRRYEKLAVKAMFRKAVCVSVHVVHPLCRVTHHICHAYGPWLVLLHRLRPHCVL